MIGAFNAALRIRRLVVKEVFNVIFGLDT